MSDRDGGDDSSSEGCEFRSLFRSDSSDASCEASNQLNSPNDASHQDDGINDEHAASPVLVTHRYMHVVIQQQELGGTIAQRLWPAAQKLAAFLLDNPKAVLDIPHDSQGATLILELGAGVGLTGLELATQLSARVLLTDLPEALPLLQSNTQLNSDQFVLGLEAVQVQALEWGNQAQARQAMDTLLSHSTNMVPLLVIGSDCVYWDCLHEPLELAIYHILSEAPAGSMCLLAGMRRWKSDTKFYKMIGNRTATKTHRLVAECINESVERTDGGREITRIYKIQWLSKADINSQLRHVK